MITLVIAIARQLSSQHGIYLFPDSWGNFFAHYGQEGFESKKDIEGVMSEIRTQDAGAEVQKASTYSILADVMPTRGKEGTLTAGSCYASDFLSATQKTGNYVQRTNNIRHARPDSCSAPRTELVNAFYENVSIGST